MRKQIVFGMFFLCYSVNALALSVPFTVTERAGVSRTQSHINYSIPLAKAENIVSTSTMEVSGYQAEFTVLSRYAGVPSDTTKPIRMVLIDFQDSIPANTTKNYTFTTNGSGNVVASNLATDNAGYVEINTGVAVFKISKTKGNLFEYVSVGGTTLVDSPAFSGMTATVDDIDYASYNNTPTVEVFRNGPMSAVVVVRGDLVDGSGNKLVPPTPALDGKVPDSNVEYAFYYWFYKGKSFVKVDQTLKNNGRGWSRYPSASVEHLFLDSWKSEIEYTAAYSNKIAEYQEYSDAFTSDVYKLFQTEKNDNGFEVNTYDFSYSLQKNGNLIATGSKYAGYAGLRDTKGGVLLADKWFWQNYPSSYEIENNVLRYSFLPKRDPDFKGYTPPVGYSINGVPERYLDANQKYRMLGGMWKTHKTLYYFQTTGTGYEEVVAELQNPLIIRCFPEYLSGTNFFSFQVDPAVSNSNYTFPAGEKLSDAIVRWKDYARSIWDPSYDTAYGKAFSTHRENRSVPLWLWTKDSDGSVAKTYPSWYGWLRFGGSPRSYNFGFNSQHYEFSYQAYQVWQRDEYYPAYTYFEEMVEYLVDILTLHDPHASETGYNDPLLHGSQRYEEDALNDNYQDRSTPINDPFVGNAHVWTRGAFVYYLLTGDPRIAEVIDSYIYHADVAKDFGSSTGETRDLTRLMGPLINDWEVNGRISSLNLAWYIWQRLESAGSSVGTDKFALDCRISADKLWIGYDAMGTPYLIRLYYSLVDAGMTSQASSLRDKLMKIAQWNKELVVGAWPNPPGSYANENSTYFKYTTTNALFLNTLAGGDFSLDLPYHWDNVNYNANYTLAWCDLYAFMYRETTDINWLSMARTAFKDRFMYNIAGTQQVSPSSPFPQPLGIPANISSGSWKFGMAIIQPLFYLQTEFNDKIPKIMNINIGQ